MLEIHAMPGHLIRRMNQISVATFMEEASRAGFDLTPVQYAALDAIQANEALDQATLAGQIAYDRVTIGGVVDRLVNKGLVRREVNPADRRARALFLTEAGQRTYVEMTPVVERVQSLMLEGLDDSERATLVELLRKATHTTNPRARAPLAKQDA
jgi:MarR family transcriptional regulator, temperature-dependent positive regulator of motility